MGPDAADVHEVPHASAETLDEVTRGLRREADQVDDDLGGERGDPIGEGAGGVLGVAVDAHALDPIPQGRLAVGLARAAAHRDDVVPGFDESGDEEGPYVAGGSDDDDADPVTLAPRRTADSPGDQIQPRFRNAA